MNEQTILVKSEYFNSDTMLRCVFLTTKEAFNAHKKLAKEAFKLTRNIEANDSSTEFRVKYKNYTQYLHAFEVQEISPEEVAVLEKTLKLHPETNLESGLNYSSESVVGFNLLINAEDVIEDYSDDDDEDE